MKLTLLKKYLLILMGSIALILGVIGILLPILPTTPFLLLASFCYLKSSKKLHHWLLHHRILGKYIYHYTTYRAIPKGTKILALTFLWTTLILSMVLLQRLPLTLIMSLVGTLVSIHLLHLRTLQPEDMISPQDVIERD